MKINMTSKTYDVLKWIALILLPAISTFYFAMAATWNLPYPSEIVGAIAAIDVFLGALLGISVVQYRMKNSYVLNDSVYGVNGFTTDVSWILSTEAYDLLKWIAQIALPALAALYFTLSSIWGFPYSDQIVATLMAIDTLMGMLLQFSTSQFNKKAAYSSLA